jgi:hypothetical protein
LAAVGGERMGSIETRIASPTRVYVDSICLDVRRPSLVPQIFTNYPSHQSSFH